MELRPIKNFGRIFWIYYEKKVFYRIWLQSENEWKGKREQILRRGKKNTGNIKSVAKSDGSNEFVDARIFIPIKVIALKTKLKRS